MSRYVFGDIPLLADIDYVAALPHLKKGQLRYYF